MNRMNIVKVTTGSFIPELIIDSNHIIHAGFTPGTVFKIEPYQDGLIIILVFDEMEIKRLLLEVDAYPHIGVDWVWDNSELYLASDCLTATGLAGNVLEINITHGNLTLQVDREEMLA
jgi:hypothetical protein